MFLTRLWHYMDLGAQNSMASCLAGSNCSSSSDSSWYMVPWALGQSAVSIEVIRELLHKHQSAATDYSQGRACSIRPTPNSSNSLHQSSKARSAPALKLSVKGCRACIDYYLSHFYIPLSLEYVLSRITASFQLIFFHYVQRRTQSISRYV